MCLVAIDIHCTHKPDSPDGMGIQLQACIETLGYPEAVQDRTGEAVNRDVRWLKIYATRQMKRLSHYADKDAIGQYVGRYFNPTGPSALDIPFAVHLLISRGIEVFTTHRS
jgi:hypothetical protein